MRFEEKYPDKSYIKFSDHRKQIVLKDRQGKVEYRGLNEEQILVTAYLVDGGIIKDKAVKKCDYALYLPTLESIRLIELKGSDINTAIAQIEDTYNRLDFSNISGVSRIYGIIVVTRINAPNIRSTNKLRLQKLLKSKGGDLYFGSRVYEENINSVHIGKSSDGCG